MTISSSKHAVRLVPVAALTIPIPQQVVKLLIRRPKNFDFQPGEYVYLNMPSLARYEWHPFTISSAPEFEGESPGFVQLLSSLCDINFPRMYDICDSL